MHLFPVDMPDVYGYWLSKGESAFNKIFVSAFLFLGMQFCRIFFIFLLVIVTKILNSSIVPLYLTVLLTMKNTTSKFLNN